MARNRLSLEKLASQPIFKSLCKKKEDIQNDVYRIPEENGTALLNVNSLIVSGK